MLQIGWNTEVSWLLQECSFAVCGAAQHGTAQHSTAQHSTAQHRLFLFARDKGLDNMHEVGWIG